MTTPPSVVFVHLGKSPVEHLWLNLKRHLELFPNIPVSVIIDEKLHYKKIPKGVGIHLFKRSKDYFENDGFRHIDQKFRRGFWRFSLERLFALEDFHQSLPDSSILHIESDVLLMPNFPWENLAQAKKPIWNYYNNDRDVSALLYLPTIEDTQKFVLRIKSELISNPLHTDMSVLSALRKKHNQDYELFPSLSLSVPELYNPLNNLENVIFEQISNSKNFPGGVFDAAPIGMWLTGHDPRNNYGHANLHDPSPLISGDSVVEPSKVNYLLDSSFNLKVKSEHADVAINVWCLHIHSKALELFGKNWKLELTSYVVLAQNKNTIAFFSRRALWSMFVQSIKGHSFLQLIYGFPLIQKRVDTFRKNVKKTLLGKAILVRIRKSRSS